jgi:hypothetical protein
MSTISTGTIATTAFVVTGDTSGELVIKTGPGAGTTAMTIDAAQNVAFANPVTFSGNIDTNGNLNFTSTGQRITGNFGAGTLGTRVLFQSNTSNTQTNIVAVENGTTGTGTGAAQLVVADSNYTTAANFVSGGVSLIKNTDLRITSGATGSATALPMTFYTGGSERFRIGTAGQLGVGGANYGTSGQVLTSNGAAAAPSWQLPAGLPTMNIVSGTTQAATANNHYVLTNASATTVTLPASPAAGDVVWITVSNGRVDNVVARNGQNINSLAENMTINSAYAGVQLRYADATRGWVFT